MRHAECILPNAFLIPNIRETGTVPKRKERCTELSWAVPVDNEHVTGLSMLPGRSKTANRRKAGGPKPTRVQDIRPGSVLSRKHEDRQRKPDDLEAEGQRTIAVPALENLAPSDTGIALLRRTLGEQMKRVSDGLDPMDVMRDERLNRTIPTNAWNTILSPTEVSVLQGEEV